MVNSQEFVIEGNRAIEPRGATWHSVPERWLRAPFIKLEPMKLEKHKGSKLNINLVERLLFMNTVNMIHLKSLLSQDSNRKDSAFRPR